MYGPGWQRLPAFLLDGVRGTRTVPGVLPRVWLPVSDKPGAIIVESGPTTRSSACYDIRSIHLHELALLTSYKYFERLLL
jgi:hypothetical protein